MTTAIQEDDSNAFQENFELWQRLGEARWTEVYVPNIFQIFKPREDLLEAMALKTGSAIPNFSGVPYEEYEQKKEDILVDFLSRYIHTNAVAEIIARNHTVSQTIQSSKTERWETKERKILLHGAIASIAGICSLIALAGIISFVLFLLTFSIHACPEARRKLRFWLFFVVSVGVSTWLLANAMIAVGPSEIGFQIVEPGAANPVLNYKQSAWLYAVVLLGLSGLFFYLMPKVLGDSGKIRFLKQSGMIIGSAYLTFVVISAFFRFQIVRSLAFGVFA